MAADPRGGVAAIFGLFNRGVNDLYLQRLEPGASAWTNPQRVASGDFGFLPTTAIAKDGTIFVVFNNGRNRDVDIGGLKIAPDGTTAGPVTLTPGEGGVTARAQLLGPQFLALDPQPGAQPLVILGLRRADPARSANSSTAGATMATATRPWPTGSPRCGSTPR